MIRVLSYNIHKGIGGRDRRYQLERVISVIERENPDIICLQEVDRHVARSRHDDQPRIFRERFNAVGHHYQMNVHLREGGYGNLLLSRWGFLEQHELSLRFNRKKPRGAQLAVIDTPEGALHLVNWHLGLAEGERHWQVAHLLEHRLLRDSWKLPTLVIGDTNDWRNTLAANQFASRGFAHLTAPPSRFRSFPAYLAMGSLDKAFCRGAIEVHRCYLPRHELSHTASDHLPLVVDLALTSE